MSGRRDSRTSENSLSPEKERNSSYSKAKKEHTVKQLGKTEWAPGEAESVCWRAETFSCRILCLVMEQTEPRGRCSRDAPAWLWEGPWRWSTALGQPGQRGRPPGGLSHRGPPHPSREGSLPRLKPCPMVHWSLPLFCKCLWGPYAHGEYTLEGEDRQEGEVRCILSVR